MLSLDCFREALGPPLDVHGLELAFARLAGERESAAYAAARARLRQLCERLAARRPGAEHEPALLALGVVLALYRRQAGRELAKAPLSVECAQP